MLARPGIKVVVDRIANSKGAGQRRVVRAAGSKDKDNATDDSLDTTIVHMVAEAWLEEVCAMSTIHSWP